jgi:hypothetical protein
MMLTKSERLKLALIAFHWQNLVKDNETLSVTELNKRIETITSLKRRLKHPAKMRLR